MLNPNAEAAAAIEEPDGRIVSEVSLSGRISRCRADTAGHCGRLRPETGLLALFGVRSQGHSFLRVRQVAVDLGMLAKDGLEL